ncbi:MAG: PepSY domain-containing protein [Candidatus Eremiobacteraeota bacterium]|nr:PepSY domain-containing protein [Candidatus Eremiobacteraeota bacterium]MCW5869267.1 PepSY domain-containing protein [Candidatus Eremiobacteraeota bacterium]
MTRRVAWLHLWLGLLCALPMFAWTSSGFLGALPRSTTSGVHYQALELPRLRVDAQAAARAANAVSDPPLKISSMTLEQRDGRLSWLVIGGSRGVRVDGETGQAEKVERGGFLSGYFSEAHFLWKLGKLRMPVMVSATLGMLALLFTGLLLAYQRLRKRSLDKSAE